MTDTGRLALVFDDGYAADHDLVAPVLAEYDARATLAIVPAWIGQAEHLSADALAELTEPPFEFEVAAHGHRHRYLGAHRLVADGTAGDDGVVVADHVFPGEDHGVLAGDRYEVTDGNHREIHRIAGTDTAEIGTAAGRIRFVTELDHDYAAPDAVCRPTRAVVRDELTAGRTALAAGRVGDTAAPGGTGATAASESKDGDTNGHTDAEAEGTEAAAGEDVKPTSTSERSDAAIDHAGYAATSFVFPYDAADPRAWSDARFRYEAVANAAVRSLPTPTSMAPTDLRRYYLETDKLTRPEIDVYLDAVAAGRTGVLAGHSAWDTVTESRLRYVLEAAADRDVPVTTLETAAGAHGTD